MSEAVAHGVRGVEQRVGRTEANAQEALWRESERRYRKRRREANRLQWVAHHEGIAEALRDSAARHEAEADKYRDLDVGEAR